MPADKISMQERAYLAALFIVASFLLLYNLDNQYFWQDEAETACLARNIVKFGVPAASDGRNLVVLDFYDRPEDYFPGKLWKGQPWLAMYMAATSFRIFGENTFAGRLPFAVLGIFTIFLTYLLARRLFRDRAVANITALLLTLSVPFILHCRQCRYFSPGIFLTVLSAYLYLDYLRKRSFSALLLLASLFLLVNTSVGYYLSVATAITAHLYFHDRKNFFCRRNLIVLSVIFLYAASALYLFNISRRVAKPGLKWISPNIRYYVRSINRYIFPWRSFLILYACYAAIKRRFVFEIGTRDRKALLIILAFIASVFPYIIFADFNSLRYVIHVAPFFYMLEAYIFYRIIRESRQAAVLIILPIALFTNLLSISLPVESYFGNYLYEITHDYDGPVEGIVKFLNKNAKPDDTVKIMYGDNACIFYTGLKVDNRQPFEDGQYPEWIIPRRAWNDSRFYASDYYKEIEKRYEKIAIPYPDIRWENRPDDMGYHKYRTDTSSPGVTIYKRKR